MRVNIYYGGRGLIDDPTLYVLEKITKVLDELRVTVERYNLYEDKRAITVLPRLLWSGLDLAVFCISFWMHAGCMATKKNFPICI